MKADGALPEVPGIHHAVYGICRIDRAGMSLVHLERVERFELAAAGLEILADEMEVLHQQAAHGNGHPAVLVAVIVH